jgi:hypothetical protein
MIKDLILSGAQALDDADTFTIDRMKYMNASSAESCIRKQWFERHSDPVEQDWGFARRGKQGELYIVDCLIAAGAPVAYVGSDQQSIVSDTHRISATPDGYLRGERDVALEFKTIDPRTNRANLPKTEHVTQLRIGMELAHLQPHDWPKPDHGVLIYMDASNYDDLLEVKIDRDPEILDRMSGRAARMLRAKDASRLDREGRRTGECKKYGGCPFAEQCGVEIEGEAKVSRGNRGSRLDDAVRDYVMAKADEDAAKAAKASAAETIKAELVSRNTRQLAVGNHSVELAEVAGRTSVDWKAAEKAGVNLDPYKKVGKPSERLTVS